MTRDDRRAARDQIRGAGLPITRRDFLNGVPLVVGSTIAGGLLPEFIATVLADGQAPQDVAGYYPPSLTGLRGNHAGSFEAAHRLRDSNFWSQANKVTEADEVYDLVVVGAGISGLSAAYFYRARHKAARVLVLDNHDDFGGHAKRNEFQLGGRLALMNGGTLEIDSPRPYSVMADRLLKALGIDPVALTKKCAAWSASAASLNIVALGASNTAGRGQGNHPGGVERSQAYPTQLEAMLRTRGFDAHVHNAGVAGDTTGGMLRRMNSAVPNGTQIGILQTGGNDERKGVSSGDAAANTAAITSKLEARGVKVILLATLDAPASTRDPDGEHFNAQGHAAIAASLLPRVLAAAGK